MTHSLIQEVNDLKKEIYELKQMIKELKSAVGGGYPATQNPVDPYSGFPSPHTPSNIRIFQTPAITRPVPWVYDYGPSCSGNCEYKATKE